MTTINDHQMTDASWRDPSRPLDARVERAHRAR